MDKRKYFTSAEGAEQLGDPSQPFRNGSCLGLFPGKQDAGKKTLLWILWGDDLAYRFK